MRPKPVKPKGGQESVWDYPRPPKLEEVTKTIEVYFNGVLLVRSARTYRVLETSHPPVYYIPQDDVAMEYLVPSDRTTYCEWKGRGRYFSVQVGDRMEQDAAWYYSDPIGRFGPIKNYLAFYAHKMDKCLVDGEVVTPQPGNFYGGWITKDVVGPFKGVEGSFGW
ncbi:DUF427 domain-containing protein [Fulvivirga sedimenti]|uniref:DUF427 domain-containing protein n=1 Tax=Fulvivirga sedimenti TaxID=2879465 RepID=A0A9X1KW86_9BACT|nr:DUF427 domain-containing protein [Fulvivirga sedimenti]MCA6075633.1 DUF427 domain-containing protein [Fulvivirga sedimenti]